MELVKVDMHVHTCASPDCAVRPEVMVAVARQRGLDRICITDHNSIAGALAARELDPELVIVGEEILTGAGDEILAFYVTEWVPPGLSYDETLRRLEAQGAVISVSHPFDRHRNRAWSATELVQLLPRLDAIEVFNARTMDGAHNQQAYSFAGQHRLPGTAGSDAHTRWEIGRAYLELPAFANADELRAGLTSGRVRGQASPWWVHLGSTFSKLRGKVGLKPTVHD
jgi:predicted metal-dependent phosphoesterase TrpH